MADNDSSGKVAKSKTVVKVFAKWLSPWGMIKTIYQSQATGLTIPNDMKIEDIREERIKNWASLLTSIICLAAFGFFAWIFKSDGDNLKSTITILSAFSLMVVYILVMKIKRNINNLTTLRNLNVNPNDYAKPISDSFEIDESAASILLCRKTFYKFVYFLAAGYAFCLVLTPKNIHGLSLLSNKDLGLLNPSWAAVVTSIMLAAILILRATMTNKDILYLKRYGAEPISQGYITINNQAHTIIQFSIVGLTVTYVGDQLITIIPHLDINLWIAAILRPAITLYMILFSFALLRTSVSYSGLQTAESPSNVGLVPVILLKVSKLPPPTSNEVATSIPPITIVAAILFGTSVWIGSNSGAVAKLTALSALFPIALLLVIQHFHPSIKIES